MCTHETHTHTHEQHTALRASLGLPTWHTYLLRALLRLFFCSCWCRNYTHYCTTFFGVRKVLHSVIWWINLDLIHRCSHNINCFKLLCTYVDDRTVCITDITVLALHFRNFLPILQCIFILNPSRCFVKEVSLWCCCTVVWHLCKIVDKSFFCIHYVVKYGLFC